MTSLQFADAFACFICVFFWVGLAAMLAWLVDKIWGLDKFVEWIERIMERLGLD